MYVYVCAIVWMLLRSISVIINIINFILNDRKNFTQVN